MCSNGTVNIHWLGLFSHTINFSCAVGSCGYSCCTTCCGISSLFFTFTSTVCSVHILCVVFALVVGTYTCGGYTWAGDSV